MKIKIPLTKYSSSLSALLILPCLTGCMGASVASLGMGSDSAAIRSSRNRQDAIVSSSELQQHRRQRQNVSEEMDLEQKKKNNFFQDVSNVTGVVGSVL
jgi:hypothetical protein